MKPGLPADPPRGMRAVSAIGAKLAVCAFASLCALSAPAPASDTPARAPAAGARPAGAADENARWQNLKPAQREALKPLQQEWSGLDAANRQKWVELADRLPSMPADERARVQARMSDWSKLTPSERGQARLRFQEAKQIPLPDRRSRWEAYQALPPEQKSELAARAAAARAPTPNDTAARRAITGNGRADHPEKAARDAPQAKSNIVPNPAYSAPPRPIGPTVMQASPGATTTLITRRPSPPPHQQTGLPKIAATPEFVNKSTLLPQRGPQGAAIRPAPASGPAASGGR